MVTCSCRVLYHLAHQSLADWGGEVSSSKIAVGWGPGWEAEGTCGVQGVGW